MPYMTQQRAVPGGKHPAYHHWVAGPFSGQVISGSRVIVTSPSGFQQTRSYRTDALNTEEEEYNHLSTADLRGRVFFEHQTRYDNGHEFETLKKSPIEPGLFLTRARTAGAGWREYVGPVWFDLPRVYADPYPTLETIPTSRINLDGSRAIRNLAPTSPETGLAQMMGEAREKLPSLIGATLYKKGLTPEAIGGEHLNVQFGIKPLIADIKAMAKNCLDASRVLKQFRRDSDRPVRRRTHLYDDSHTTILADSSLPLKTSTLAGSDETYNYFGVTSMPVSVIDQQNVSCWFSGAFQYHLAEADDFFGKAERYEQLANALLGSRFDESTVWELTPWSWLIDWEIDIGGWLKNVSLFSNDSLVLRYGYVMHKSAVTRTWTAKNRLTDLQGRNLGSPYSSASVVRKQRTRSTPYGFGLNPAGFSPSKWAILGALGMTKSAGTLRYDE